jgi:hypothetical protein
MSDALDPRNYTYEEPEDKDKLVFAKGIYKFRILEVNTMTESKENKNPMIPIKFEFSRAGNETTTVYDNLVFTKAAKWKIDQFLSCICGAGIKPGRTVDWEDPTFLAWVATKTGTARLKVSRVQGKDYDRNDVENYVFTVSDAPKKDKPLTEHQSAPPPVTEAADDEDDIPF